MIALLSILPLICAIAITSPEYLPQQQCDVQTIFIGDEMGHIFDCKEVVTNER